MGKNYTFTQDHKNLKTTITISKNFFFRLVIISKIKILNHTSIHKLILFKIEKRICTY